MNLIIAPLPTLAPTDPEGSKLRQECKVYQCKWELTSEWPIRAQTELTQDVANDALIECFQRYGGDRLALTVPWAKPIAHLLSQKMGVGGWG